jgi:hypothetical protein
MFFLYAPHFSLEGGACHGETMGNLVYHLRTLLYHFQKEHPQLVFPCHSLLVHFLFFHFHCVNILCYLSPTRTSNDSLSLPFFSSLKSTCCIAIWGKNVSYYHSTSTNHKTCGRTSVSPIWISNCFSCSWSSMTPLL